MRDWIAANFSYVPGVSHASTSAADSFLVRQGVCRDYAHVLVSMARAASIPARYASVYAPDVDPPDFHAVAEVWLAGDWHLVDATGMARPDEIARIGVGRDAADSSFLSSFGIAQLVNQEVKVTRV
jgi:transglutaminase-like putative cysteine protease